MVIANALIALFWLVTLQRLVRKRTSELDEKNKMLCRAYEDMEARVRERTVELAQSNQSLQAEIAEHKLVEEALRESEEKYRSLASTADSLILVDRNCRYLFANENYLDSFGPIKDSVFGRKYDEFHDEEDARIFADAVKYVIETGNPCQDEWSGKRSGRCLLRTFSPFKNTDGNITAVIVASKDITNRKRMEKEKAELESQNQQLQKAESLSRMAGSIAHYFNNQLGVVMGNLELAIVDLYRDERPIAKLNAAMKAALRAAKMSGQMLTYLGQTFGNHEPLDLADACKRRLPLLHAVMPGNAVLVSDLLSPGPTISANENQIQQVLTNLVTNAWEAYGDIKGTIHLRVKTVSPAEIPVLHRFPIGWQPQDNIYACLEVADNCGIESKDIENIFDPFFSSKFTGRGLGLAVVLGIVRAHDGVITVESAPGKGSAFRVYFPASSQKAPRQPDKEVQALEIEGGGTVLLVEDEEAVRNMTAAMLANLGLAVLEAKDGVEAVDVFRGSQGVISCVLCDLDMPRMNGWDTLATLRKLAPDIPVILSSGYDEGQVMTGHHPEWPQAFLGKPYKLQGLSNAISQALNSKKDSVAFKT